MEEFLFYFIFTDSGILMSEENVIFAHLDTFCNRVKCVCDQITSLAQFQSLYRASSSLSRPKREELSSVRMNRKDLESAASSINDDDEAARDDDDEEKNAKSATEQPESAGQRNPLQGEEVCKKS